MLFYLDTEFIEDGITIDLISIAIVAQDGQYLYLINKECDFSKASDWVLNNVLLPIGLDRTGFNKNPSDHSVASANYKNSCLIARTKTQIAFEVISFIKSYEWGGTTTEQLDYETLKSLPLKESVEIWGYYADYDWVVFCQLFGSMINLPTGFPMYCRDIKQLCDQIGNPKLPKQSESEHNALFDARWNKQSHEYLIKLPLRNS